MKRIRFAIAALVGSGFGLITTSAKSEDASWGCQVLLCAASQNPSWHGVGYCVPPYDEVDLGDEKTRLFMAICHEANAGKPGHEPYEECPAGTSIGYSTQGDHGGQGEPDQCIKTVNVCQSSNSRDATIQAPSMTIRGVYSDGNNGCVQQIATPRPRRADPYFFDIPNEGGVKQRFWFNLNY